MKIFHDRRVGQLFWLAGALGIIFPALYLAMVYPKYRSQMLEMVKNDASRVTRHLSRMARYEGGRLRIDFGSEHKSLLLDDFGLLEIQMIDKVGRVVYSTSSDDIGEVIAYNFIKELAQGREFARVVASGVATSDGMVMDKDIIEVYVPIISAGAFIGACGLYYDISVEQRAFDRIYFASFLYPLPLMFIFLGLVSLILKRLDNQIVARQFDKEEIEAQHALLLHEQEKQRHLLKHVENAKRQWEATMDRVDDMVIVTDVDMRIRRCNRAVCAFSGVSFAEILNQRLADLFVGLELDKDKGEGKAFEYLHPSGRWFYMTLYQVAQTVDTGWVITAHDVTEIKKISAELERKNAEILETSKQLQHAIDGITALINRVVAEQDFGVFFSSDFSKRCSEVMGCGKADCPYYDKEPGRCWHVDGTLGGGHSSEGQFAKKYEECANCPYFKEMTANPINMIGEQFNNMMSILAGKNKELQTAYSELKQAQSHLLQQEKMASIGQLAAGVAHEINNPVGFISSNLNSLRKYSGRLADFIKLETDLIRQAEAPEIARRLAEEQKKFKIDFILNDIDDLIRESTEGCERVKKIVLDLKGFSRVDQAKVQTVDIHECIDSTLNIVWNELKYKAKIEKDYQATSPIRCFPQQMNQVFMNLLVNAAHAIEKEGVITIKTWQDTAFVHIAISDTGRGIRPEDIGHVFEPFFTTKEVGKGTGLGLSIVYDIVTKNHQGNIQVESEVGRGTTFTVKIPFAVEG